MDNESKFGLLAGIVAVIVVAVVYYQKTPPLSANTTSPPPATGKLTSNPKPNPVGIR
ncbi:MAG: hypothetical protein ACRC8S_11925 [Fimbriiglobus sp.]